MCMFQPSTPDTPELPPERQAQRLPDNDSARDSAGRRETDRTRAGVNTIMTGGSGVTDRAPTGKKTLLGQ